MLTVKRGKKTFETDGLGYQFSGAALDKHGLLEAAKYSHALDSEKEAVICGKAKYHMFLDDGAIADAEPTCPGCRKLMGLPEKEV